MLMYCNGEAMVAWFIKCHIVNWEFCVHIYKVFELLHKYECSYYYLYKCLWKSVLYFLSVIQGRLHLKAVCLDSCRQSLRLQVRIIISQFLISVRFHFQLIFQKTSKVPSSCFRKLLIAICVSQPFGNCATWSQPQTAWFWHVRG